MKTIYIVVCIINLAIALNDNNIPQIIKYENINDGTGSYKFSYETSDGIVRNEEGVLRNAQDPEHSFIAISGSYSYLGTDGITYTVHYIADENGFQPQIPHEGISGPLPTMSYSAKSYSSRKNNMGKIDPETLKHLLLGQG